MLNHTDIPGTEKCFDLLFLAPYARTTRYEEAFCLKAKNGLGHFAPSALPHYYIVLFQDFTLRSISGFPTVRGTAGIQIISWTVFHSSMLQYFQVLYSGYTLESSP